VGSGIPNMWFPENPLLIDHVIRRMRSANFTIKIAYALQTTFAIYRSYDQHR